jgi:hypothetical protein
MIITHVHPDFDCIVAIWLLKRFCGMDEKRIEFMKFGEPIPKKFRNAVFVDIGGGEFDHHNRNDYVSSATLVLKKYNLNDNPVLQHLANIAREIDHGKFSNDSKGILNLINILGGLNKIYPDRPEKVTEIAFNCLDAIYEKESKSLNVEKLLESGIKFSTHWGPGIGLYIDNLKIRNYCHEMGYVIFVYLNKINKFRGFASQMGSGVDFSGVYEKLRQIEPDAEWYLHFSKDLLICGSNKAVNENLSSLDLEELISLIRSNNETRAT